MDAPAPVPAVVDHDNSTITVAFTFTMQPWASTDKCEAIGFLADIRRLIELFTTLDSDGGTNAWTLADWNDGSGDLLANLTVQVRPYAVDPKYGHTGTCLEFAEALERIVERLK